MPIARSVPQETSIQVTSVITNPPDSFSRLDVGGVPVDVFSFFDVPMTADEKVVGKLKTISDWAKEEGKTMGDALLKIKSLETHLGSPDGLNKRYQKVWEYCKMDLYSKELDKKKEALRRRF
jgi:hypothetical protein